MRKKLSVLLLVCMLCLSACGTKNGNNGANTNDNGGTSSSNGNNMNGEDNKNNGTANNANGGTITEGAGAAADKNTGNGNAGSTGNTGGSGNSSNSGNTSSSGSTGSSGNASNNSATNNGMNYKTENVVITDADTALKRLQEGNDRFVNDQSVMTNVTSERRAQLQKGQKPYACVVACSDSRVTPNIIFNTGLGEIFEIRIAGNVVDDNALGSIEYAVEHLGTPLILVMGHEACGAVTAAYDNVKNGTKAEGNIESLVEEIAPAIKSSGSLNQAIGDNVVSVADQIAKDEIVNHLVHSGKVRIVEAYYSLDGKVTFGNQ